MDEQSQNFIRKHGVTAPLLLALVIGFGLYRFTDMGWRMAAAIAIGLCLIDIIGLSWLLKRAETRDD